MKNILPMFGLMFCVAIKAVAANTILVTSTNDSGAGSLRDAIEQANGRGGGAISISVTGTIALASSLPPLRNVQLRGPGTNFLRISGNDAFRPFEILSGSTSRLTKLTISNGRTTDSGGGGISNHGWLTIDRCAIELNHAEWPAVGGGIYNDGNLTIVASSIANNGAVGASRFEEGPGLPAIGGGIYSTNGLVGITNCIFHHNSVAGGNGGGGSTFGPGGQGGEATAGAIMMVSGDLSIAKTVFDSNETRAGNGRGVYYGAPGGYARGGALALDVSSIQLSGCKFRGNAAYGGKGGGAKYGAPGGSAVGAAVAVTAKTVFIADCSLLSNTVVGGSGGSAYTSGSPGGAGSAMGGGLAIQGRSNTTVIVAGSTFAWNRASGGLGGSYGGSTFDTGGGAGNGGDTKGAGIFIETSRSVSLMNVTFSSNSLAGGDAGLWSWYHPLYGTNELISGGPGQAVGAGLFSVGSTSLVQSATMVGNSCVPGRNAVTMAIAEERSIGGGAYATTNGTLTLRNCLVAGNRANNAPDAFGIMSDGFNLFSATNGITNLRPSDIQKPDARIGPLQDNDGPTWTHALLADSAAIDHGDAGSNRVDQRGFARGIGYSEIPSGSNGDDIGSFESDPTPRLTGIEVSGDEVYLRISTRSDAEYRIQSKTNISATWVSLGLIRGTGGTVRHFVGPRGPDQQFFRVVQQ